MLNSAHRRLRWSAVRLGAVVAVSVVGIVAVVEASLPSVHRERPFVVVFDGTSQYPDGLDDRTAVFAEPPSGGRLVQVGARRPTPPVGVTWFSAPDGSRYLTEDETAGDTRLRPTSAAWQRTYPATRWSPNGRYVAYAQGVDGQLFVVDERTGRSRWLGATGLETQSFPVWSPDGDEIAVGTDAGESGALDVYARSSGRLERTVPIPAPDAPASVGAVAWSSDGRRIAFSDDSSRLWVTSATSGRARWLASDLQVTSFAWAPDADLLVVSGHRRRDEPDEIFLVRLDGYAHRLVSSYNGEDLSDPVFAPDGSRIAYLRGRRENRDGGDDATDVETVRSDGTGREQLTVRAADGLTYTTPRFLRLRENTRPVAHPKETAVPQRQFPFHGGGYLSALFVGDRSVIAKSASCGDDLTLWDPISGNYSSFPSGCGIYGYVTSAAASGSGLAWLLDFPTNPDSEGFDCFLRASSTGPVWGYDHSLCQDGADAIPAVSEDGHGYSDLYAGNGWLAYINTKSTDGTRACTCAGVGGSLVITAAGNAARRTVATNVAAILDSSGGRLLVRLADGHLALAGPYGITRRLPVRVRDGQRALLDGTTTVTVRGRTLQWWELATGRELKQMQLPDTQVARPRLIDVSRGVVAYSVGGRIRLRCSTTKHNDLILKMQERERSIVGGGFTRDGFVYGYQPARSDGSVSFIPWRPLRHALRKTQAC